MCGRNNQWAAWSVVSFHLPELRARVSKGCKGESEVGQEDPRILKESLRDWSYVFQKGYVWIRATRQLPHIFIQVYSHVGSNYEMTYISGTSFQFL